MKKFITERQAEFIRQHKAFHELLKMDDGYEFMVAALVAQKLASFWVVLHSCREGGELRMVYWDLINAECMKHDVDIFFWE